MTKAQAWPKRADEITTLGCTFLFADSIVHFCRYTRHFSKQEYSRLRLDVHCSLSTMSAEVKQSSLPAQDHQHDNISGRLDIFLLLGHSVLLMMEDNDEKASDGKP